MSSPNETKNVMAPHDNWFISILHHQENIIQSVSNVKWINILQSDWVFFKNPLSFESFLYNEDLIRGVSDNNRMDR